MVAAAQGVGLRVQCTTTSTLPRRHFLQVWPGPAVHMPTPSRRIGEGHVGPGCSRVMVVAKVSGFNHDAVRLLPVLPRRLRLEVGLGEACSW